MKIRPARYADLAAVDSLLAGAGLPERDLANHLATLLVGEHGGAIVAAAALEPLGADCLLRSVVVARACRGRGWGERITQRLLDLARAIGFRSAWLLTAGASDYFAAHGFVVRPRETAPPLVRRTRQLAAAGASAAVLMRAQLDAGNASLP